MEKSRFRSDSLEWAYNKYIRDDPELVRFFEEELVKAEISSRLYKLRNEAGLTQAELADLVGTPESVINYIEEADYEGDYFSMVVRIAKALKKTVKVDFVGQDSSDSTEARP